MIVFWSVKGWELLVYIWYHRVERGWNDKPDTMDGIRSCGPQIREWRQSLFYEPFPYWRNGGIYIYVYI